MDDEKWFWFVSQKTEKSEIQDARNVLAEAARALTLVRYPFSVDSP